MVLGTTIPRYSRLCKLNGALQDCKLHTNRGCVIDFGTQVLVFHVWFSYLPVRALL